MNQCTREKQKIDLKGKRVLVTGCPGFIGAALVIRLLGEMSSGLIVSLDNLNDYYDPELKLYRLGLVEAVDSSVRHVFVKGNIADCSIVEHLFKTYRFDVVVHLAARYDFSKF